MDLQQAHDRLGTAKDSDRELDEFLFAQVYGWHYPLVGAAYNQFHAMARETGETEFSSDTESAFRLAGRVLEKPRFRMEVDGDGPAVVTMTGAPDDCSGDAEFTSTQTAKTLAAAICRCVVGVLIEMEARREGKEYIG